MVTEKEILEDKIDHITRLVDLEWNGQITLFTFRERVNDIITIITLIYIGSTINEFNEVIKNVEDNSQSLLIDSLQLEIMQIGSELDSMYLKYDL